MKRLTTDKPVSEMGMYELAHNSCYIDKNGATRYRDFETDIDARDLARNLMVDLGEWSKDCIEMTDDDSFDWAMLENLANAGVNQKMYADGLIALFYRNLWAMAELRERLKHYEDLEEQGVLLKLPCKVGKTVYLLESHRISSREKPLTCVIDEFTISDKECYAVLNGNEPFFAMRRFRAINIKHFGKIVFLTREEAEAKLKEMQNANN